MIYIDDLITYIKLNTKTERRISKKKRRSKKYFLNALFYGCVAITLLGLNLVPKDAINPFEDWHWDTKHSTISQSKFIIPDGQEVLFEKIKTVDDLVYYTLKDAKDTTNKRQVLESLTYLARHRFVHAYSVYNMQENWMAVLAGKFIWKDLAAKVIPDDILEEKAAACSQVSIVIMAACKKLGIPSRKVGLVGHYTAEALIGGNWYFIDADLKPDFKSIRGRKSLAEILRNKELFTLYANTHLDSTEISRKFARIHYGKTNSLHAPKAYLFHVVTKFLSHWLWLLPLGFAIHYYRKRQYIKAGV
jgi:hypothetical protein